MIAGVCNEVSKRSRSASELAAFSGGRVKLGVATCRAAHPVSPLKIRTTARVRAAARTPLMERVLFDIAQICEFGLEPPDLIRFLGLFQSILIFLAGIPILAHLTVGIPQMLGDSGIATG